MDTANRKTGLGLGRGLVVTGIYQSIEGLVSSRSTLVVSGSVEPLPHCDQNKI